MKLLALTALLAAALPALAADPLTGERTGASASVRFRTGEIEVIDHELLTCDAVITFDDVEGGAAPGASYDEVFESGGALVAERFVGQTLGYAGTFDVLGDAASSPLDLQAGEPGANLNVFAYATNAMCGLGNLGFPDFSAIGEGSFAVLFDYDQSEFGFDLVGGGGGTAYVSFFRRDGSLIDTVELTGLGDMSYGFRRAGGVFDIAGVSVYNDDEQGIGFDNLCHDNGGTAGQPPACDAGGPYDAVVGVPLTLDGTGSFDLDGEVVAWTWEFGDDTQDSGALVEHVWMTEGTYTVILTVVDDEGLSSWCETLVVVTPSVATQHLEWGALKATYR